MVTGMIDLTGLSYFMPVFGFLLVFTIIFALLFNGCAAPESKPAASKSATVVQKKSPPRTSSDTNTTGKKVVTGTRCIGIALQIWRLFSQRLRLQRIGLLHPQQARHFGATHHSLTGSARKHA